jgi:hypothetical protein
MAVQHRKHTVTLEATRAVASPRSLEAAGIVASEKAPAGIVLARLVGWADGRPLIRLPGRSEPVIAACAGSLAVGDVERLVAVMFLDGNLARPVVMGPVVDMPAGDAPSVPERLELAAGSELVLRCGPATLRLLADGTAVLRGVNVVTRAAATNRIRGGNVQIN